MWVPASEPLRHAICPSHATQPVFLDVPHQARVVGRVNQDNSFPSPFFFFFFSFVFFLTSLINLHNLCIKDN